MAAEAAIYRNSKIGEIYEGANEVQQLIIVRQIFGRQRCAGPPIQLIFNVAIRLACQHSQLGRLDRGRKPVHSILFISPILVTARINLTKSLYQVAAE